MNTPIPDPRSSLLPLAQFLENHRDTLDSQRCLPDEAVAEFVRQGLWKLWVPREFGGAEMAVPDALELFETAAELEPVLGWSVTIGTGGGLFAAWLPEAVAAEIYEPEQALIAGSGAPTGAARPVEGGYRVSGRWRYCSGAPHATWFTASVMVEAPGDEPAMRAVAVPADEVIVEDTWDTAALQGTGSHDIRMEDVFVPENRLFNLMIPPRIDRTLYRYPFMSIAEASFGAVALGYARGALTAFAEGPARRRPMGGERTAADFDAVQERFGQAEMRLRAARAFFRQATEAVWEAVVREQEVTREQQRAVTLATVHAVTECREGIDRLCEAAGMGITYRTDPLGRFQRGLHALSQHAMTSPLRAVELGRALLETSQ